MKKMPTKSCYDCVRNNMCNSTFECSYVGKIVYFGDTYFNEKTGSAIKDCKSWQRKENRG